MCKLDLQLYDSAGEEQSRHSFTSESSENALKTPKPQHSNTGMSQFNKCFPILFVTTNVSV